MILIKVYICFYLIIIEEIGKLKINIRPVAAFLSPVGICNASTTLSMYVLLPEIIHDPFIPFHFGIGPSISALLDIRETFAEPLIFSVFPSLLMTLRMAPILPPYLAGKPPA